MDIGPSLPPHLSKKKIEDSEEETIVHVGPFLSPNYVERNREEEQDDDDAYGPALPPHLAQGRQSQRNIGPSLLGQQDEFKPDLPDQREEGIDSDEEIGPVIGPMPSTSSDQNYSSIEQDIEARSKAMKDKLLGKNNVKQKREEWMTELPPEMSKNFGLGPRTFRKQAVDCGDRSVWTDTPSDNNKKQKEQANRKRAAEDSKALWEEEKEKNMNKMIESFTKQHRGESLMDMHQHELNKKRKEEGIKPNERRPFDRDRDLGHTTIDPEKRKSLLKKSQQLDTRFHHSKSGSSFL